MSKALSLPDTKQSVWQLSAIQMAGWTSLPTLATSIAVLEKNSFWGSLLTIFIGNTILWFIRLGIVAMSYKKRQSTLDIARDYLGKTGSYFIAILLLMSTLFWFVTQTTTGSYSITHLIHIEENARINQFMQAGVLLGTLSTVFCMGGIIMLRKLSVIAFPLILIAFIGTLFALPKESFSFSQNGLSLSGLTLVLATNLGITADLPTFFRHSKSWLGSIKALTLVQGVSFLIGICGLFFGTIINRGIEVSAGSVHAAGSEMLNVCLISFIFLSVICTNVANVYSASVGWELVAPKSLVGRKEYFILGLGLTTIFILVAGLIPTDLLLRIFDSSLVNLCLVLIVAYIIRKKQGTLPDQFGQVSYFTAWFLSSLVSALQLSEVILTDKSSVLISCVIIGLILIPMLVLPKKEN